MDENCRLSLRTGSDPKPTLHTVAKSSLWFESPMQESNLSFHANGITTAEWAYAQDDTLRRLLCLNYYYRLFRSILQQLICAGRDSDFGWDGVALNVKHSMPNRYIIFSCWAANYAWHNRPVVRSDRSPKFCHENVIYSFRWCESALGRTRPFSSA